MHLIFSSTNCNDCHWTEVIQVGKSLYLMRAFCSFKIHFFGDVSRSQAWIIVYKGCTLFDHTDRIQRITFKAGLAPGGTGNLSISHL